jgi:hypothetical protein
MYGVHGYKLDGKKNAPVRTRQTLPSLGRSPKVRSVLCARCPCCSFCLPQAGAGTGSSTRKETGCSCIHLDHPFRGFSSESGLPMGCTFPLPPTRILALDRHLGRNAGAGKLITDTCLFWANVGQRFPGIGRARKSRKLGLDLSRSRGVQDASTDGCSLVLSNSGFKAAVSAGRNQPALLTCPFPFLFPIRERAAVPVL